MKNGFDTFIFDLGNVLVSFNHRIAVEKIAKLSHLNADTIYDLFFDSSLTRRFEEGKISAANFFKQVKEMLKINIDYKTFLPIWNEIFFLTRENKEVLRIAKRLKRKNKLLMISNINKLHFEYLKERYPILWDSFDKIILSYREGVVKPSRKIYQDALSSVGSSDSRTVYIDDRLDLITEARKRFNFHCIRFRDSPSLKQELKKLNISAP